MNECPKCGHRYNKRIHGNKCPDCGYRKGVSKFIPYFIVIILVIVFVFKDFILDLFNNSRIISLFNIVNPVYIVIAINVILYALGFNESNAEKYGNSYYDTIRLREYYRLISSGFTHADILHLLCNMYSLYNLGNFVYNRVGGLLFIIYYFLCMVLGGFISALLHHYFGNNEIKSIGASGAICSLLGFYIVFIMKANINPLQFVEYIYKALLPLGITAFNPRIDSLGHLSGLVLGIVLSFILTSALSYTSIDHRTNQTIPTNVHTREVTKITIYNPDYVEKVVEHSFYVENIDLFNNVMNDYENKLINELYNGSDTVNIKITVLENITYSNIEIADSLQIINTKEELIDYLLCGNDGQSLITFITKYTCNKNGQYFEKVFYNNIEQ